MLPVAVLFGLVCLFWFLALVRPFSRRTEQPPGDRREQLLEEKRGLLFALRDAELDFTSGKLYPPDYEAIRTRLEARTAALLAEIDALDGGTPAQRVEDALEHLRRKGS